MAQEGFIVDVLIVLLPFIGDIACYETQNIMNHGVHHSKDSTDRQTDSTLFVCIGSTNAAESLCNIYLLHYNNKTDNHNYLNPRATKSIWVTLIILITDYEAQ